MLPKSIKILLIDDDEDDYVLFRSILNEATNFSFDLIWEANPKRALHLFSKQDYDICFLDQYLGNTKGLEIAKEFLDQQKVTRYKPFILLTSSTEANLEKMASEYGAYDCIYKHRIKISIIERIVRFAMELYHTLDEFHAEAEIVNCLSHSIIKTDLSGNILWVNEAFTQLTGYSRDEVLGRKPSNFLHGRDTDINTINQILESRQNYHASQVEIINYKKDGTPYWAEVFSKVIRSRDGKPKHFISIANDISERKQQEDSLKRALIESKKAEVVKNEFLAKMNHEIRTPINAILGFSDLLKESNTDPEDRQFLSIINQNGKNLLRIINNILEQSVINADKLELVNEPTNIRQLTLGVVESFQLKTELNNNRLQVEIQDEIPCILIDSIRIRQILYNLIDNANKFSKNGDISVTVRSAFNNESMIQQAVLIIQIKDTGIGISEDKLTEILKPFSQSSNVLAHSSMNGPGLGLSIANQLIEKMNGKLSIESNLNKGSSFTIRIPQVEIYSEESNTIPENEPITLAKSGIVITAEDLSNIPPILINKIENSLKSSSLSNFEEIVKQLQLLPNKTETLDTAIQSLFLNLDQFEINEFKAKLEELLLQLKSTQNPI